jgi:hypothetical protein
VGVALAFEAAGPRRLMCRGRVVVVSIFLVRKKRKGGVGGGGASL